MSLQQTTRTAILRCSFRGSFFIILLLYSYHCKWDTFYCNYLAYNRESMIIAHHWSSRVIFLEWNTTLISSVNSCSERRHPSVPTWSVPSFSLRPLGDGVSNPLCSAYPFVPLTFSSLYFSQSSTMQRSVSWSALFPLNQANTFLFPLCMLPSV